MLDKQFLRKGNPCGVTYVVDTLNEGESIISATLMIKAAQEDLDTDALYTLTVSGADIKNHVGDGTCIMQFDLPGTAADDLDPQTYYWYSIKYELNDSSWVQLPEATGEVFVMGGGVS